MRRSRPEAKAISRDVQGETKRTRVLLSGTKGTQSVLSRE